jgi:hypothetical protein
LVSGAEKKYIGSKLADRAATIVFGFALGRSINNNA